MTPQEIIKRKSNGPKLTMLTCYDNWSAKILNDTPVDMILIGDSGSMVMHGNPNTLHATTQDMAVFTKSVSRGAPKKFIVADMPFLTFRRSISEGLDCMQTLMQAGAHSVKLEGASGHIELVKHATESGIPIMGHLGLTPQSSLQLGGFKVQGRLAPEAERILNEAKALEQAGCFAVVLECVPAELAKKITQEIHIPTIGIGAGVDCDGQVLVLQDMLGFSNEFKPKFLRTYLNGHQLISEAIHCYCKEVHEKSFPSSKESY